MQAMNIFMAGFFLTFSFFKMLDLNGFAESYSMYDIVAKKIKAWGYIYAFIELGLGIAYATNFQPLVTNIYVKRNEYQYYWRFAKCFKQA